ncbi:MAG: sulfate adenylyltransferase [Betaproteobacteria bacterium]|jgi:sulfate adenylyltransferase subunit 1|nr:sulfate adenylyltransferase [Betaproteobacteria bacterium]
MANRLSLERTWPARSDVQQDSAVLRFITAGSVDDGKSTLIGRLLHDSRQILEDQLSAVEQASRKRGQTGIDLSLLTDGLEAEREQGITIDVAYRYFATPRRKFIIADTPGHAQYTRNMATGASSAHAAVILADATKGLLEQSKRHLYIAHLLGIRDVVVAVNKMDLVHYDRGAFDRVRHEFAAFADRLAGAKPRLQYIPISALEGAMVVERGDRLGWYTGPTLLELLEAIEPAASVTPLPLRFPVQLVQRTAERGRTYLGRVASGCVRAGQRVVILPAGVTTTVKAIYYSSSSRESADAGDSIGLALTDEIDVARGDLIAEAEHQPKLARSFNATLVWLTNEPLQAGRHYLLKHTTRTIKAKIALVSHLVDVNTLEQRVPSQAIGVNSIVHAALTAQQPLVIDSYAANRTTGAFILIDEGSNQTVAAGMIG